MRDRIVRRCLRDRVEPLVPIEEDPIWEIVGMVEEPALGAGETVDDVLYGPIERRRACRQHADRYDEPRTWGKLRQAQAARALGFSVVGA